MLKTIMRHLQMACWGFCCCMLLPGETLHADDALPAFPDARFLNAQLRLWDSHLHLGYPQRLDDVSNPPTDLATGGYQKEVPGPGLLTQMNEARVAFGVILALNRVRWGGLSDVGCGFYAALKYPDRFSYFFPLDLAYLADAKLSDEAIGRILAARVAQYWAMGAAGFKCHDFGLWRLRTYLEKLHPDRDLRLNGPIYVPVWRKLDALKIPIHIHVETPYMDEFLLVLRDVIPASGTPILWTHLGFPSEKSNPFVRDPENRHDLTTMLESHPNIFLDITPGQTGRLVSKYWRDARGFFERFQDRITFGTDVGYTGDAIPEAWEPPWEFARRRYWELRMLLEYDGPFQEARFQRTWHGMGLTAEVCEKIYRKNLRKILFPGGARRNPQDPRDHCAEMLALLEDNVARAGGDIPQARAIMEAIRSLEKR